MIDLNVCICLCVYNNEFGLPFVLKNIHQMVSFFKNAQIIVFYDHSIDSSLSLLNEYKQNYKNMEIIIQEQKKFSSRVENICFARNFLLHCIREKYSDYDYFIMMDSNEYSCIGEINIEVLKNVFQRRNEWDSISFDREAGYYDTWALSFNPFIYSFFHFQNWQKVVDMMRENFHQILTDYKTNKPQDLIPVYSAFNGFAIYKTEKFIDCQYNTKINLSLFSLHLLKKVQEITDCKITNQMTNDCEHRSFHLEAIQKNEAKIRICTQSLFAKVKNPPKNSRGPC